MDFGLGDIEMVAKKSKKPSRHQKKKKRLFSGMDYRQVQRDNSNRRGQMPKIVQASLKTQGYKNVGWDNVTALYQKLNELSLQPDPNEDTLEDLFLKADRVGSKYQTREEVDEFNRKLAAAVGEIADIVDRQFPEPEVEFVDYSRKATQPKPTAQRKRR